MEKDRTLAWHIVDDTYLEYEQMLEEVKDFEKPIKDHVHFCYEQFCRDRIKWCSKILTINDSLPEEFQLQKVSEDLLVRDIDRCHDRILKLKGEK